MANASIAIATANKKNNLIITSDNEAQYGKKVRRQTLCGSPLTVAAFIIASSPYPPIHYIHRRKVEHVCVCIGKFTFLNQYHQHRQQVCTTALVRVYNSNKNYYYYCCGWPV